MEQPMSMFAGLDGLIAQLETETAATAAKPNPGTTPQPTPTPQAAQPPAPAPATQPAPATTPATPPATPATPPQEPADPGTVFGTGKQNATFAAMRVQNKEYLRTLNRLGEVLGIPTTDPAQLMTTLMQKANELSAANTGVPPELLSKLDALTQDAERRDQEAAAAEATRGFQRVKDEFKLTPSELMSFAVKLRESGKNPFETPMDLIAEYKLLYYDQLVEKAKNEALASASALQQHGQAHSSQPNTNAPATPPGAANPVNTVAGLESILQGFNS